MGVLTFLYFPPFSLPVITHVFLDIPCPISRGSPNTFESVLFDSKTGKAPIIRVVKTVVLRSSGLVLCRKQVLFCLTKTAKMTSLNSTQKKKKTSFLVLTAPKTTKMARVTQAKAWFTESGVMKNAQSGAR